MKALAASGLSSTTIPKKPISSHEVAESIRSLNRRCQHILCPTIRPNEINFLPQPRHTGVQKIRKLIELRDGDTVHVEIRQCEVPG
jgi:hypothetical protein